MTATIAINCYTLSRVLSLGHCFPSMFCHVVSKLRNTNLIILLTIARIFVSTTMLSEMAKGETLRGNVFL